MNKFSFMGAIMLFAIAFCSCENPNFMLDDEEGITTNPSNGKSVKISLRSASTTPIEYPVRIYAFDENNICRGSAIITDETENSTTIKLTKGTYRVTAISLPDTYPFVNSNISPSSILQMPESGYANSPFSTGNADITVTSSASQSVSIRMGYRQAAVNVTLLNTPANVTSMDISLSTPYHTMSIDGSYGNAKSVTVPSVKSGDVWETGTFYIMPTQQSQTVLTMHLTLDDGSSESYSYTYNATLNAGIPYFFTGNYDSGESNADIIASIQGGEWGDPIVTDFNFGPGADKDTEKNKTTWYVTSLPKAGDVLNGHVIIASSETSSNEAELLLISLEEWSNVYSVENEEKAAETTGIVNNYTEDGLREWRFPTEAEAKLLHDMYCDDTALANINTVIANAGGTKLSKKKSNGDNLRYLCEDGRSTFSFLINGNILSAGKTVTYNLRLVKSITAVLKQ
ncbi:MAG: FimB/Mfa2 family fimbrial subunit [Prevotella sp.]|nr:FimB/Mfa2 family fimbrial subunit [Prevotella sp.]